MPKDALSGNAYKPRVPGYLSGGAPYGGAITNSLQQPVGHVPTNAPENLGTVHSPLPGGQVTPQRGLLSFIQNLARAYGGGGAGAAGMSTPQVGAGGFRDILRSVFEQKSASPAPNIGRQPFEVSPGDRPDVTDPFSDRLESEERHAAEVRKLKKRIGELKRSGGGSPRRYEGRR